MSTQPLLPSADPVVLPPQATTSDLHLYDTKLRQAAVKYGKCLRAIGYYGWRLQLADQWQLFQCEDEEAYRESLDIPRSTYYKWVRIGKVLHSLTLEQLEQVSTSNLEILSQLDADQIPRYLEQAVTQPPTEFAKYIADCNQKEGSAFEPKDYVRYKVPVSSKKFLEEAVGEFQAKHNLASPGRALELMVADIHDRLNVMGVLLQIRNLLAEAQEKLADREPEVHQLIEEARIKAGEAYTQALSEAREGKSHKGNGRFNGNAAHA